MDMGCLKLPISRQNFPLLRVAKNEMKGNAESTDASAGDANENAGSGVGKSTRSKKVSSTGGDVAKIS